jgi:hypothetical protein
MMFLCQKITAELDGTNFGGQDAWQTEPFFSVKSTET